jgi:DNA-binding SARP family transcriptional activator
MTGRAARRRGPATAVRGGIALMTLVALVIGLPLALYKLGGDPLPRHIPAWHHVTALLLHRDNGTVFLGAVRDISWIAWAAFTVAVATEAQAALRGRRAPRLRLGGMQHTASWLIALIALAFTSQPAAVLASTAPAPVVTVSAVRTGPPAVSPAGLSADRAATAATADPSAPQVMSMGLYQMVTVRSGDCLWSIAQRYLGDGDLYPEIVKLNLGHHMGDGQIFADPSVIWPGWVLQLPASPASGLSSTGLATPVGHPASPHGGHDSRDPRFSRPHPAATAGGPATDPAGAAAVPPTARATAGPPTEPATAGPPAADSPAAAQPPAHVGVSAHPEARDVSELGQIPPLALFASGVLVGGASVALARMRRRQRQARRFGRRIPVPASAPVIAAEQRLRAAERPYRAEPESPYAGARPEPRRYPDAGPESLLFDGAGRESRALLYDGVEPEPGALLYDGVEPDSGALLYDGAGPEAGPLLYDGAGRESGALLYDGAGPEPGALLYDGPGPEPESLFYPGAGPQAEPRPQPYSGVAGPGPLPPATALRAALSELGSSLVAAGQPIPDVTGALVHRSGLELLLASPSSEPPPPPFAVPGGRQGTAWQLELPRPAPSVPVRPARAGDLLPGLLTAGVAADGGYVLIDLEYLRVTTVDGPADLADLVLATAAAELTTSQLAGWYDLILAGFPELEAVDGRATSCASLAEALDLLASRAVALRRRLGDADRADVRRCRLIDPGDEDWALTLLVSRTAPTSDQMAMLADLASDPGGIAALVAGGTEAPEGHPAPASFRLATDLARPGGIVGHVSPLHLDVWPQPLTRDDYQALASLFQTAADLNDVAADEPPYDGSSWPPAPGLIGLQEPPAADEPPAAEKPPEAPSGQPDPPRRGGDPGQQPGLRIGVMGTFTINGAPAALQPAQSQLILALALNGRDGLSNAQLCYLLGADPDHPKPSDSLRQLIVRTRRQLGRAADGRVWIEHLGAGQYALHPDAKFDWADFEELAERGIANRDISCLREALALIRGKPFTGCYHWWLDLAFTETVRAQIVDTAELLAELELRNGDPSASARAARTGLSGDLAAEQLWRALMRAEHAAGNLAGVREAWSRCLDTMTDIAADGEPHPETAALYQQLTGADRAQAGWAGSYR